MAVAARGYQKESFAERRHHNPSTAGEKTSSAASSKTSRWGLESFQEPPKANSAKERVVPSPALSRVQGTSNDLTSQTKHDSGNWPMKAKVKKRGANEARNSDQEDEDEEIGVHMWENRGKLVMEVPWFRMQGRA